MAEEDFQTSALHVAAGTGDLDTLTQYLEPGVVDSFDLDEIDGSGRTPLIYAVHGGFLDCMELLLSGGANANIAGVEGKTALHWCAIQGKHKFIKVLLAYGASVAVKDTDGRTALHLATGVESSKCVKMLCKDIAPNVLNGADNDGMTAAHWCAFHNHVKHLECLIEAGADLGIVDLEGKLPIHLTISNTDETTLQYLMENDPEHVNATDPEGRTVLHLAIAENNVAIVEFLVSAAATDIDAADNMQRTALHWAAVLGHHEFVAMLLKNGAKALMKDSSGATAMHYAAQNDEITCVKLLLTAKVQDIGDTEGRTALMWAAGKGSLKSLKVMAAHADLGVKDNAGGTALHIAAFTNNTECVKILLEAGADINAVDATQTTPLMRACEAGHSDAANALLLARADVTLADIDGRTALHWAALAGFEDICNALIASGASVQAIDVEGRAPLHCASYGGFIGCMNAILAKGAQPNLQDNEGVTALHWAAASGSLEAVTILVSNHANVNVLEFNGEKLSPLDYAIIGDGTGSSFTGIVQYLTANGALSVTTIRDMAAVAIQATFRGYRARKTIQKTFQHGKLMSPNASRVSVAKEAKPWVNASSHSIAKSGKSSRVIGEVSTTNMSAALHSASVSSQSQSKTSIKSPSNIESTSQDNMQSSSLVNAMSAVSITTSKTAVKSATTIANSSKTSIKSGKSEAKSQTKSKTDVKSASKTEIKSDSKVNAMQNVPEGPEHDESYENENVADENVPPPATSKPLSRAQSVQRLFDPQFHLTKYSHARLASQKEQERIRHIREKVQAATVIQRAWKRHKHRVHQLNEFKKQLRKPLKDHGNLATYEHISVTTTSTSARNDKVDQGEVAMRKYKEEVAALTIQLAWRKHQRESSQYRKSPSMKSAKSVKSAKSIRSAAYSGSASPSKRAQHVTAQEVRIASTYGRQPSSKSRATTATKRPTTSKVLTYRPTYLHTIPSAAAVSFNFALGNYTPARIEDVKKYSRAMHSHVLI